MLAHFVALGRPHLPRYVAGFALLLLTNGLGLWIPWLLRDAIRAMEGGAPVSVVGGTAGLIALVAAGQAIVRTLSRLAILGASRHVVFDLRERYFRHLLGMGASFYDGQRTGDIMSRGIEDVRQVQGLYGPGVMNLLNTAIVYVAVLALLFRLDPVLTLVSLAPYPFLFLGVNRISRRVWAHSLAVQEQLAEIGNRAQENISGIQQIAIHVQEDRELEAFRGLCAEYRRRSLSLAAVRGAMVSLIGLISGLATLVVLFVGGRFVVEGRLDFGGFVAFNAYLALLVWPTIALGWILNTLQRGAASMQRIHEILDAPQDHAAPESSGAPGSGPPLSGDIELRGLRFRYDRGRSALHGIDLTIPRGSRVAIVGPVGSGKSTLANLLARFYEVPRGTVFIGGTDVTEVPLARLRRSIGYVPQEAFLFSRTLRENVAFGHAAGSASVSEAEVERAVAQAQLQADLPALPHGLDTVVGERGFTLSGGQRQRTTLARAMLADRPILILDDSLSAVDADTERHILRALEGGDRDRTLILITHRLSTLHGMDRIVVMDEGRIAEQGSHAELLRRGGTYAELFRRHQLEARLRE